MIRRKYTPLRLVQPGMRIDQAIIDRAGRVLIARRTPLEDFHIDALRQMGVSAVYIQVGEADEPLREDGQPLQISEAVQEKYEQVKVEDPAKVKISESVRSRVAQSVQYLYQDTQSESFMDATRSITDDLVKAISDNDAIAVDISALKISDEYTFKHSVDVATMSMIVAKKYGMSEEQVYEIGIAGLLHDIGKSQIPDEILNKAGKLTDEEFDLMKKHSLFGYHILEPKQELSAEIKLGVLQHHEKTDGRGYPMKVTGDKIGLFARIISVADIYDALVTERPYKKPFSPRDAVEMIMSMTGELDINAMRCFLESVILYPVGTDVALSNGETARVIENIPHSVLRPKVLGLSSGRIYNLATDIGCANIIIL
ncbi:MAG: HD-GYP domain-containing protein [Roseburia sp.]|nr:HD-GYP domain-containing protein [Roseburia sp.]